ncbi:MAG: hypothetical protein KGV59_06290 [Tenacibaculum sp.]|nr:hypothetical protein [Tenacibaculum sp.]
MKQLTIKEIASYLPYKVECIHSNNKTYRIAGAEVNYVTLQHLKDEVYNIGTVFRYEEIKLRLRDLSNLTKEIEYNGEKFIPIEKLKEDLWRDWCDSFDEYLEFIHDANYGTYAILQGSYRIIQKLLEWHFDIFNLRKDNLCVYYNEVNKQ